jgi:hypothetical protein
VNTLSDFRQLPLYCADIAAREQTVVRWFIVNWIDSNVHPHPLRDNLGMGIAALVEQWTSAASSVGISPADIEAETGYNPADLILTAFLARWNPQSGQGGCA